MRADEKETGRLEAFSDGVFAIAMTLLALDLRVPQVASGGGARALGVSLAHQWPAYMGFVVSFVTVLIMWVNHHGIFKLIRKVNAPLLFANGLLLMLVTTVPFSTALLAEYFERPGGTLACAVYAGDYVLLSVAFNLTWLSASRGRALLRSDAPEQMVRRITRSYRLGMPMYLIATLGAMISVTFCIAVCSALCVFWVVTMRET